MRDYDPKKLKLHTVGKDYYMLNQSVNLHCNTVTPESKK